MRVGESVWFCKRLRNPDEDGNEFAKPIEIKTKLMYFTVMGKKGFSEIENLGDTSSSSLTAVAQPYDLWKDVFHNNDLFYCNGAEPVETEEYYGQLANYRVSDVDFGNMRIKLTLDRVENDGIRG